MSYVFLAVGVVGLLWGLRCWIELRRWARQCNYARIAIAYKGKVKIHSPLTEWLLWVNNLDKDKGPKGEHGRPVYHMGGTTVAITKTLPPPGRIRRMVSARNHKPIDQPVRETIDV